MSILVHPLRDLHWSARLSSLSRQLLALLPAVAIGIATAMRTEQTFETPVLLAWLTYIVIYLSLTWLLALRLDARATRLWAQWNDPGAPMLFMLATLAACASLAAVLLAVDTGRSLHGAARWMHLGLALLSLAGSWLIIQTVFALHYTRGYYHLPTQVSEPRRGLDFPGDQDPDYLDFLYFSAVIGMTSQVSDVTVQSRAMRRLTLAHSLLSFGFNLVVLAVAVNVFANSLGIST